MFTVCVDADIQAVDVDVGTNACCFGVNDYIMALTIDGVDDDGEFDDDIDVDVDVVGTDGDDLALIWRWHWH